MLLHEELRRAREQAGLTQAELAKLAGVPRNQIVRAEKGQNLTLDTLRKIAAHLPVTSLRLLDDVQMTADLLAASAKIYREAMATVTQLTEALGAAVRVAMEARAALAIAQTMDPSQAGRMGEPREEDVRLLESLEAWHRELQKTRNRAD